MAVRRTLWLAVVVALLTAYGCGRRGRRPAAYNVFVDRSGRVAIKLFREDQYGTLSSFSEGLAAYYILEPNRYETGYIDKTGRVVVRPRVADPNELYRERNAMWFSEGMAAFRVRDKWGYIDKTGKLVIPPHYDGTSGFLEGLAAVTVKGKTGYVDRTGAAVIKPRFSVGYPFNEGLAVVAAGGKKGFVDKSGHVTFVAGVDEIHSFSDGVAVVRAGEGWGYIDTRGKFILKPENVVVSDFSEGLGLVWPWAD